MSTTERTQSKTILNGGVDSIHPFVRNRADDSGDPMFDRNSSELAAQRDRILLEMTLGCRHATVDWLINTDDIQWLCIDRLEISQPANPYMLSTQTIA